MDLLIPRRAAAPLGPETTHRVCSRVLRMWSRSASSRVIAPTDSTPGQLLNSRGGLQNVVRSEDYASLNEILQSRMLPGHGYEVSSDIVSGEMRSICLPILRA